MLCAVCSWAGVPAGDGSVAQSIEADKRGRKNRARKKAVLGAEKWKLIFSVFIPHGSKEKISGSDFEILATNFKKQATNFLPPENPSGWCRWPMALRAQYRLPVCSKNADKNRRPQYLRFNNAVWK